MGYDCQLFLLTLQAAAKPVKNLNAEIRTILSLKTLERTGKR